MWPYELVCHSGIIYIRASIIAGNQMFQPWGGDLRQVAGRQRGDRGSLGSSSTPARSSRSAASGGGPHRSGSMRRCASCTHNAALTFELPWPWLRSLTELNRVFTALRTQRIVCRDKYHSRAGIFNAMVANAPEPLHAHAPDW